MLHGTTIRSTIPRGRDRSASGSTSTAPGFTVVDHRDIPGRNVVALIEHDQPCLAEREIRHVAEPILLLAHEDREELHRGGAVVAIDYRASRAGLRSRAFGPRASRRSTSRRATSRADSPGADRVVEGEYRTGHQEQLYIEPNGVIAVPENGGITVYGSLQCPYYVHRALRCLLGAARGKVRVVQTETGGGFGGKEEYPSMIAGHAALLALKSGRPVKIVYDRVEDMVATTKRHPVDRPPSHRRRRATAADRAWTSTCCSTAART